MSKRDDRLRVLIVDDHAVVQWGFKVLLGSQKWVERCIVASTPEEGLAAARAPQTRMSRWSTSSSASARGLSCARRFARASPETRVLLISGVGWISPQAARTAGAARVRLEGLERRRGRDGRADGGEGHDRLRAPEEAPETPLSEREREVLALIATGATNKEIAERLYLSPHTVKEHASTLYRKLGVKNRAEATRRAERLGLTR